MQDLSNYKMRLINLLSAVGFTLLCNYVHAEDRFRIISDCSDRGDSVTFGSKVRTPFGDTCFPYAYGAQETPTAPNLFVLVENARDRTENDLKNQIVQLKAEIVSQKVQNAQWQKDALKDTLDRLEAMPQSFAAKESVQKIFASTLTPLVVQEIIKSPTLLKQVLAPLLVQEIKKDPELLKKLGVKSN
jgi:hypothetical protein